MDRPMTIKEMARTAAGAVTSLVIVGSAVFSRLPFFPRGERQSPPVSLVFSFRR